MSSSNGKDAGESRGEGEVEEYTSAKLSARELEWAVNPPDVSEEHRRSNAGIVRTRFPPEPNGYLHVGHAKSMNMNFSLAFEKLGVSESSRRTIFRYDDTNPDAESTEYIDSIRNDLLWLGWKPERTTYSSDNFQKLYEFAVKLIERGLAYVCDMTKDEMERQRDLAMKRANARNSGKDPDVEFPVTDPDVLPGRNRDTSVERNLRLFQRMKMGMCDEGSYTLRLKMDFESSNPNMYDLVAYRIKYTPHPHAGAGWCIYPAYDFTHGICDSLERIDYSICTLEFETRREPYYWILWALDLYRPKVYEMSRLNIQYVVLSKRRLIKLVDSNYVRGWDDPRMPTISGLRRRGYNAAVINSFCDDVGATRAMNVVEMSKLQQTARLMLSSTSRRIMACLKPIKVVITNFADEMDKLRAENPDLSSDEDIRNKLLTFQVQNSPTDPSMGSHTVSLTPTIYIDSSDFRTEDSSQYYGLVPNKTKAVGLKYHGGNLLCHEAVKGGGKGPDDDDEIVELRCTIDTSGDRPKPKTYISWVPEDGVSCEVRVYDNLFTVPEPTSLWEDELNPESEIVYPDALVDPSVYDVLNEGGDHTNRWVSNPSFQFERMGYFVLDYDTRYDKDKPRGEGKIVFNRTVSLKEEVFKKKLSADEEAKINARKEQAKKDLAEKERRMQIDAKDLFKSADEYKGKYSQYNEETGIPTHDADGKELTKSAVKKLAKEQQKHVKHQTAWKKNNPGK